MYMHTICKAVVDNLAVEDLANQICFTEAVLRGREHILFAVSSCYLKQ